MSAITTHVLDTAIGRPAAGVAVVLEFRARGGAAPVEVGRGVTDSDGRLSTLAPSGAIEPGDYQLTFDTGAYFAQQKMEAFYPRVVITWTVLAGTEHYHIPLLLSPFGYSTYRGS